MFKPKGLSLIGMVFVLMLSGAGMLFAQNGPGIGRRGGGLGMGPGMGDGPMFRLHQAIRGLDLTDEQRDQIRDILDENRNQIEQTRRNVIEAGENLDPEIPETAEALGAVYAEAALLRARIQKQIEQLLTADQLSLLEERRQLRRERLERFPGRFGRGDQQ